MAKQQKQMCRNFFAAASGVQRRPEPTRTRDMSGKQNLNTPKTQPPPSRHNLPTYRHHLPPAGVHGSRSGPELLLELHTSAHKRRPTRLHSSANPSRAGSAGRAALLAEGFYWVVLYLRPSQSRFFPSVCAALAASLDAANAHITHFNSHDSGIHVVSTGITRWPRPPPPLARMYAVRPTGIRGVVGLCVGACCADGGSDQAFL